MAPLCPVLQQLLDAVLILDVSAWILLHGHPFNTSLWVIIQLPGKIASGSAGVQRTHMEVSSDAYVGNVKGKVLQISFSCSEIQWAI